MKLIELSPGDYAELFDDHVTHVYNTAGFNIHNSKKTGRLRFLGFADSRMRLGIILGEDADGSFSSPFSAPFGGFTATGEAGITRYIEAAGLLAEFVREHGSRATITVPPPIYGDDTTFNQAIALNLKGRLLWNDLNYHIPLCPVPSRTIKTGQAGHRRHDFRFEPLEGTRRDIERVHAQIKANHDDHGYPLHLSADDIESTAPITGSMFFVMTCGGTDAAAAMVNRVSESVAQVIYWGDAPEARHLRPMDALPAEVSAFFAAKGYRVLDIGPSSSHGVPALGLCQYKERVGCRLSPKPTFIIE